MQEEDNQSVTSPISKARPVLDGENLMLRRTLLKVPHAKEPTQRKTPFKTTCRSYGKICKVIVDSGSTENIVEVEMVDKHELKRFPHTNPYKLSRLSKEHVLVDEKAWVDFKIGEYKDRVLCDILPMDACHLFLGRPWQYDVKALHDGEKNSYVITKEGRKIQMDPLVVQGEERHVGSSVMLLSGKEFLKDLKHEGNQGCAIIVKPKVEAKAEPKPVVPQVVKTLLDQYKDIVVNEIPDALPPYRGVNH